MRIDVTYASDAPRIIETSGESLLSSATMAGAPEWRGGSLPVTAVMLRPRTDLLVRDGHGLVVEVCGWSADVVGQANVPIDDLGGRCEVPRLAFHVFRVWEVLPADDLARAVDVDIDGRIHLCRIDGQLLDLTAYERLESVLLSTNERSDLPLDQRVLLVHDRLRWTHPGLDDEELGNLYGLGSNLIDYARAMAGATDDQSDAPDERDEPDNGFGALLATLAGTDDRDQRVDVLADAMFDDPDLTFEALAHAMESRDLPIGDLENIWADAENEVDVFSGI